MSIRQLVFSPPQPWPPPQLLPPATALAAFADPAVAPAAAPATAPAAYDLTHPHPDDFSAASALPSSAVTFPSHFTASPSPAPAKPFSAFVAPVFADYEWVLVEYGWMLAEDAPLSRPRSRCAPRSRLCLCCPQHSRPCSSYQPHRRPGSSCAPRSRPSSCCGPRSHRRLDLPRSTASPLSSCGLTGPTGPAAAGPAVVVSLRGPSLPEQVRRFITLGHNVVYKIASSLNTLRLVAPLIPLSMTNGYFASC